MALYDHMNDLQSFTNPRYSNNDEDIYMLQSKVGRLETIVYAMYEVLKKHDGIGEQALLDEIEDIVLNSKMRKRPSYDPVIINCPKCGKAIQESRKEPMLGRCHFCGETVLFKPFDDLMPPSQNNEQ